MHFTMHNRRKNKYNTCGGVLKKKFLCAFILIALFAGSACADINVGLLSQLNMTQAEFQTYMDAALSSGLWTMFSAGDREPAIFVFLRFACGHADGTEQGRSQRDRPS